MTEGVKPFDINAYQYTFNAERAAKDYKIKLITSVILLAIGLAAGLSTIPIAQFVFVEALMLPIKVSALCLAFGIAVWWGIHPMAGRDANKTQEKCNKKLNDIFNAKSVRSLREAIPGGLSRLGELLRYEAIDEETRDEIVKHYEYDPSNPISDDRWNGFRAGFIRENCQGSS